MAVLFAAGSVLPSLVPRSAPIQGLLTGACAALGYGLGALVGALVRRDREPGRRALLIALLLTAFALAAGLIWQRQLAALVPVGSPGPEWVVVSLLVAAVVMTLLLLLGRAIRGATRALSRTLHRVLKPLVATIAAVVIVTVVALVALTHLPQATATLFSPVFRSMNASTPAGVTPPTSDYVSGGPASQITWSALGSQGQAFVSGVTPADSLSAFSGAAAADPIRVFVGVGSSQSAQERAQLAVSELERFGAFDRPLIAVGTSAGSGTVDPGVVVPLEYLLNGDVATVSTQYSILPSFLSIMVDQQNSIDATRTLLDAIRARLGSIPAKKRPALVVFGESLGAYGANGAFNDLEQLLTQTSGALFEGPPNSTAMWRTLTSERAPGSPEVLPVYDNGAHVRWANQPADLNSPAAPFRIPRAVYLQNASDPVVWWSPRVLWSQPDWLREPRGPGVLPWLPWLPVFTFSGLTGDMINSQGVPAGHGHVYGTDPVAAWAAILQPPGWTDGQTAALQQHLAG